MSKGEDHSMWAVHNLIEVIGECPWREQFVCIRQESLALFY